MSANFAWLTVQALLLLHRPVEGPCFLAARANAPWKFIPVIASPTAIEAESTAPYYTFADGPPTWIPTHVTSPTPATKTADDPCLLRGHGGIRGSMSANFAWLTVQALLLLHRPVEGPCFLAARANAPWKFIPVIASPTAIEAESTAPYYTFADGPPTWIPTHVTSPTPATKTADDPCLLRGHGGIRGSMSANFAWLTVQGWINNFEMNSDSDHPYDVSDASNNVLFGIKNKHGAKTLEVHWVAWGSAHNKTTPASPALQSKLFPKDVDGNINFKPVTILFVHAGAVITVQGKPDTSPKPAKGYANIKVPILGGAPVADGVFRGSYFPTIQCTDCLFRIHVMERNFALQLVDAQHVPMNDIPENSAFDGPFFFNVYNLSPQRIYVVSKPHKMRAAKLPRERSPVLLFLSLDELTV
ncbi:hypothetical protein MTO96_001301 [Rhipicephalus appendiculatus]